MKNERKIDAMHREHGKQFDKKCRTCRNLIRSSANRVYRKCLFYGVSNSDATDWRTSNTACGMWGIKFNELKHSPLYRAVNTAEDETIKGQISLWEGEK